MKPKTNYLLQVIIPGETGSKVVLKNLSRMDAGLYICTADNQVNEGVEKITKITVKCKFNQNNPEKYALNLAFFFVFN